jgi:ketosteroid isomerase-like protein
VHDELLHSVERFVDAVNNGDAPAALSHFAPDVVIVEDLPPFRWQGPDAGSAWLLAMHKNAETAGLTSIVMRLESTIRVEIDADDAYAVFAGHLKYRGHAAELHSRGCVIFTLRKAGAKWLIRSLIWGGPAARP